VILSFPKQGDIIRVGAHGIESVESVKPYNSEYITDMRCAKKEMNRLQRSQYDHMLEKKIIICSEAIIMAK
jgi:hypothetical protein